MSKAVGKSSGVKKHSVGRNRPAVKSTSGKVRTRKTRLSALPIQFVFPVGNAWVVKSSKAAKFTLITISRREAVAVARTLAKNKGEILKVYGKDGRISERKKYSSTKSA